MIDINLDHFQNGSKFLKKVTIDSKNFNTVEINISIISEAVVGAIFDEIVGSVVGAFLSGNIVGADDNVGLKETDGDVDGTRRLGSHSMLILS